MRGFLFGLGMGIGLGILFAPSSGEETRGRLGERANELKNSARESIQEGRGRVQRGVEAIRGKAERAVNQPRTGTDSGTTGNL